jgi:hypothetical protein
MELERKKILKDKPSCKGRWCYIYEIDGVKKEHHEHLRCPVRRTK